MSPWWSLVAIVATGGLMATLVIRVHALPRSDAPGPDTRAAVVIPARNEEAALPGLLRDLQRQTGPPAEIVVVDDGSTDATADVATAGGAHVVSAGDRPAGWNPKVWALDVGVAATDSPLLVFLDADVRLAADALERVVGDVERSRGLVSIAPHHRPGKLVESASAPCNVLLVAGGGPGISADARGAVGSCLAIGRADYESIGGHRANPATIVDDLSLAAAARDAGLPTTLRRGGDAVAVRSYPDSFGSLWQGWTKNLAAGMRHTAVIPGAVVGAWLTATIAPIAILVTVGVSVGLAAWAVVAAQTWWLSRLVGRFHPLVVTLGAPVLGVLVAAMTATSLVRAALGRPTTWKGRPLGADGLEVGP